MLIAIRPLLSGVIVSVALRTVLVSRVGGRT